MTWAKGKDRIQQLVADGELQLVEPSPKLADRLTQEADAHLVSARTIKGVDRNGAYQLAYDAARKACSALLAVQGIRATVKGGHIAVQDAVIEQFNGPSSFESFKNFWRLRRGRADKEYPGPTSPTTTESELDAAVVESDAIVGACRKLLDSGRIDRFV